ncbi:SCO2583 family membrane protein [Actinacidiphila soli]|uniref:SCO2583 family membrane protein n=1 Tax=Actinacidiphila soli TaxID=2487275 RepID=UPI000FCB33FF|nr:hypothetical protein [Actinacidiphila soli]
MAGPGDPPAGTPEGVPGGGDDEYRSVVFDESFIRAARIQEYSARERLDGTARAVHVRRFWSRGGAPRQALILVLLIAMAFGTAIYLGIRNPYQQPATPAADQLRITLIPLAPTGAVPAVAQGQLFAGSPAADYRIGAEGVTLPPAHRTGHFAEDQVMQALTSAKDYLVASAIDPGALTGGDVRTVRTLLAPGQLDQFDRSLERPVDDGRHAATGWLVRFDPTRIKLADEQVRVQGGMTVSEVGDDLLEVVTDHTLVYAVRDAGGAASAASLFTVRRELRFRFDRDDLRDRHVELVQSSTEAGPLSCTTPSVGYFQPLLAGQQAQARTATDPFNHDHQLTSVCGVLAPEVSVSPQASRTAASPAAGSGSATPASP